MDDNDAMCLYIYSWLFSVTICHHEYDHLLVQNVFFNLPAIMPHPRRAPAWPVVLESSKLPRPRSSLSA